MLDTQTQYIVLPFIQNRGRERAKVVVLCFLFSELSWKEKKNIIYITMPSNLMDFIPSP